MTAQMHEQLILDGERTSMAFCPPLPEEHSRIYEPTDDVVRTHTFVCSSACWRGYQGTWEIKGGRFFLVDLCGKLALREGEPILADWFTGVLRVPRGERLQYVHMGFGTIYEEEIHIKVEKGLVVRTRIRDNRGKEFDQFEIGEASLPGGENSFPGDDEL